MNGEDARLDRHISNFERFGRLTEPCLDCEVGEPHVCRKLYDRQTELRRYQLLTDLVALNRCGK